MGCILLLQLPLTVTQQPVSWFKKAKESATHSVTHSKHYLRQWAPDPCVQWPSDFYHKGDSLPCINLDSHLVLRHHLLFF